jgi:hypothetical protein
MLSVIMLSVIMLTVIMLTVIMLSVITLCVIMLSAVGGGGGGIRIAKKLAREIHTSLSCGIISNKEKEVF